MKKLLLASVAFFSVTVGVALAADLPVRTLAPAPSPAFAAVPMFTWSGFYAGAHAGYLWTDADARAVGGAAVAAGTAPSSVGFDNDGLQLGAQAGFNAQFGAIVAGVEGDLSWTNSNGSSSTTVAGTTTTLHSDLDWLGTLRGRLGVAFDRTLVYATGGFAFGDTNYRGTITGPGFAAAGSNDDMSMGYAIGAGVEYAFTNNMTLKAEWLYYDLGRETVRLTSAGGAEAGNYRFQNDGNVGRVGVNFKF